MKLIKKLWRETVIGLLVVALATTGILYYNRTKEYRELGMSGLNIIIAHKELREMYDENAEKMQIVLNEYNDLLELAQGIDPQAKAYRTMIQWAKDNSRGIQCEYYIDGGEDSIRCTR